MKKVLKSQKGINLISLSIAVIMILIITNVILYNVKGNLGIGKLQNMQTDIKNLRDKISTFYAQNGKIPASIEYTNINNIKQAGVISTAVDTGKFYVIDLASIDNLTLNYGEDYKKIKSGNATTSEEINNLVDLYIINETSHNIFFVEGIEYDNEWFYTDYTAEDIETKAVDLIDINTIDGWSPTYDKTATYKDKNGDTAIIPERFKVSRNPGEDTIQNGLVVRGPDQSEFVWVPVEDINSMAQCSTAGGDCDLQLVDGILKCTNQAHSSTAEDIVGKLWSTTIGEDFGTENTTYTQDSGLREPDIVKYYDNNESYNNGLFTLESLKNDYKQMATSVKEYGGFYIGRYETSLSTASEEDAGTSGTACSKVGVVPTAADNQATYRWYGLYTISKTYEVAEDSVQSSMIWGSQYDAMLNWVKNGNSSDKDKITQKTNGNHSGGVVTTGNSSYSDDSINNIRDLEGNLFEWTLEANDTIYRVFRGGGYDSSYSPCCRNGLSNPVATSSGYGSRLTLYIK